MLPQLQAEERLTTLNLLTAGGSMSVDERSYKALVADLRRDAGAREKPVKATASDIAALGIAVERVPKVNRG